jgi:serine/threonine-protein kinase HipA
MNMGSNVSVLDVLLHGNPVGTLTRLEGDRTIFAFNEEYIADENRPTLSLGFKDAHGRLITDFKPVQRRIMPFFSNLLPEGPMRAYLAERARVNPEREFFLLWVLGKDLPGAVTVEPADGETWPIDATGRPRGSDQDAKAPALRFSLAGVQLKFSAIEAPRKGLTIPAEGVGGSWIVKLPSREFAGVPENEYAMMTLAGLVGIDVPAVRLVDVREIGNLPDGAIALRGHALAVQRFDRLPNGGLVHMEDFAQIFGVYPDDKYKKASYVNIARVIAAESNDADIAEFIRRLTFSALIGNADLHLKNLSMVYVDKRNAALAPAYDLVSTILYIPDDRAALTVSRTRRFAEFSEDELRHLAARARLSENVVLDAARETVESFHQHWQAEKKNLPLSQEAIARIEAHTARIPLGRKVETA